MFQVQLIYTASGKKYTFPQEILEKVLDKQTLEKLKTEVLKEVNKL